MTQIRDLTIESIAAGGDGVARADGMVVFVPRSAPGDHLRATIEQHRRLGRGTIVEITEPSPRRVEPPCPHYREDRCGGCQLQHLAYDAQLDAKSGIVRDSLVRLGRREVAAPDVMPSDAQWRYRRKLTLAMRRRRGGRWVIGLHPYDDPAAVFQLRDCLITDERVLAAWKQVIAATATLPDADELRAAVQLVGDEGTVSVVLEGGTRWPRRDAFFAAVPSAVALWWKPFGGVRRLVAQRGEVRAAASFAQVNAAVAARLRDHVLARASAHAPATVVDAYAGVGDTAVALAAAGARVTAIELDREAVHAAAERLPAGSRAVAARVEDAIERALPADLVVVNPPRTGVHERVTAALEREPRPRAVLYVSCNPATLARDLGRLPHYRVASLRSFDMFPQTAHVETVCELVPEAA